MNKFLTKSPLIIKAATLIAAVLLGLAGARSINVLLQTNNDQTRDSANNSLQHSAKSTEIKVDYRKLASLHLLGEVKKQVTAANKKQEIIKAPETNLNLQLIGVLFNGENEDSYAIIAESGKTQKTFRKGDKVPGNATLYAVEPNRVILERNGRHETLSLLKPDINAKGPDINHRKPAQAWRKDRNTKKQPVPGIHPRAISEAGRKAGRKF